MLLTVTDDVYSDLRPSKPAACQQISLITNYKLRNKRLLTGQIMEKSYVAMENISVSYNYKN